MLNINCIDRFISMSNNLGYGPCLSDDEYEKKIIALHCDSPSSPSRAQDRETRRWELELAIDHRLGVDFPRSKRDALWDIQQKVEKKRGRLFFKYLLMNIFSKSLAQDAQSLARYLVKEYSTVLNQKELDNFFGREEARNPSLPIDLENLK